MWSRPSSSAREEGTCPSRCGRIHDDGSDLDGDRVSHSFPGRVGAGALVESGDVALQFDAGRAPALRMVEAGARPARLDGPRDAALDLAPIPVPATDA
jgi:hypothetical protein